MTAVSLNSKARIPLKVAALRYARLGFAIFPITAEKKSPPLIKNWPTQATTDQQQIKAWWNRWPYANIGIATGQISKLLVLDIDSSKDGFRSLANLITENGELPVTAKQRTGSGVHYLFKCEKPIGNSVSKIGLGIDTRGNRGYIVAAPSVHPNGSNYEWSIEPNTLANAPDWLLSLLHSEGSKPAQPSSDTKIIKGQRNDTLFRRGCALLKKGKKAKDIGAELIRINHYQCKPPLPDSELNQIIDSVRKQSVGAKRPLFQYREFVCTETPKNPTLRHILHMISFYMDVEGKPAYPTIQQIAERTGYSEPTVGKWIKYAVDNGYIVRRMHKPKGQKWANSVYLLPNKFVNTQS